MANHSNQIAVAPRLDPDDTESVLGVLVGDAFDQPRQHLSIGWIGLRLHNAGAWRSIVRILKGKPTAAGTSSAEESH